ncbi:MAG: zf-HC2 domain-containing protein [Bacillaceae bacterium]|nr:zf-HC2 domain-containing protein [Bacillaceae bacterium]
MSHLNKEEIKKFIDGTMAESEAEAAEHHLDRCEECFEQYLQLIETWDPEEKLSDSFTDATLALLEEKIPDSRDHSSGHAMRKTLINYGIAAGLTIGLMFAGVFQKVIDLTDVVENRQSSITAELMKRTTGILENFEPGKEDDHS